MLKFKTASLCRKTRADFLETSRSHPEKATASSQFRAAETRGEVVDYHRSFPWQLGVINPGPNSDEDELKSINFDADGGLD